MVSVLIVDDDQRFRAVVSRHLEREPELRIVDEAGDGEASVRSVRETAPDVVLMDISMPGIDGLEATRRIKAERPTTKIVILTIFTEEAYRKAASESGADAFLVKNTLTRELLPTIRRVLGGDPDRRTV